MREEHRACWSSPWAKSLNSLSLKFDRNIQKFWHSGEKNDIITINLYWFVSSPSFQESSFVSIRIAPLAEIMLTSTSARRLVSDFSDFAFASVGWSCGSGCGCGGFRGASSSGFASLLPWLALLAPALAASALLSCCNRSYASCFILLSCYSMLFNFHSISQCDEGTFRGDLDLSGVTSQHCWVRINFWSCLPAHARSIPIETKNISKNLQTIWTTIDSWHLLPVKFKARCITRCILLRWRQSASCLEGNACHKDAK